MYTLRKITETGIPLNFYLGNSYSPILKEENPKEFERMAKVDETLTYPKVMGFVSGEGAISIQLFKGQQNYIMNNEGGTIEKITFVEDDRPNEINDMN